MTSAVEKRFGDADQRARERVDLERGCRRACLDFLAEQLAGSSSFRWHASSHTNHYLVDAVVPVAESVALGALGLSSAGKIRGPSAQTDVTRLVNAGDQLPP